MLSIRGLSTRIAARMSFLGLQDWKLCRRIECDGRSLTYRLPDGLQVRLWLAQVTRRAITMIALRTWLASPHDGSGVSRMSDQAIIDHVAVLISRGVIHVHTLVGPLITHSSPRAESVEPAPRSRPREVSPVVETETSTLQDDIDPATPAATLTAAAASGTPFCPT